MGEPMLPIPTKPIFRSVITDEIVFGVKGNEGNLGSSPFDYDIVSIAKAVLTTQRRAQ